jgi:DNA polymerase epsilon subunit 1
MNWNICEQLPEEGNCREKLETFITLYIEQLTDGVEAKKALKTLSHHAYDIVQKLFQIDRSSKGPALEFIKSLCKILSVDSTIEEELNGIKKNMLRLVGIGEFSDLAVWKDTSNSYVLNEVICKACNHCRDLDLLKDKHRALKNDNPVWLCAQCFVNYDTDEIEVRLIDSMNRKIMSYMLQDLKCVRCKEIKQDNITEYCHCAGSWDTLIPRSEILNLMETFQNVAEDYNMSLLRHHTQSMMKSI